MIKTTKRIASKEHVAIPAKYTHAINSQCDFHSGTASENEATIANPRKQ
jgi:hypothetical protein